MAAGLLLYAGRICMDVPTTLADALDALALARVDVSALDALTAEHNVTLEALAEANRNLAASALSAEASKREINALKEQIENFKANEANANAKAVEIVAALGVEPVALVAEEASPLTKKTLAERLEGVTDPVKRGQIRAEYLNSKN
jgi:hypothetical protein